MSNTEKKQAAKQQTKPATKPAAASAPPRQVKRAPPVTAAAQTSAKPPEQGAKPPAPVERLKPLATQLPATALDGFSGFNEEVEGADRPQGSGGVIQGRILKFTNPGCIWVTSDDGKAPPAGLELIPVDIARVVEKWIDEKPVREETIIVAPGQKFPDVKAMNEAAPKSEWREYQGQMIGPWQMQYLVYLLNAHNLDRYTFPTSTFGGGMACRELADKVAWMRKYRGPNVNAVVTLATIFRNNRFGGRQSPHFQIVRWIGLGGGGEPLPAPQPALEGGAAAKPETPPWQEVEEPSLAEELDDDLPDDLK